mgnify:CR=1 FL=1
MPPARRDDPRRGLGHRAHVLFARPRASPRRADQPRTVLPESAGGGTTRHRARHVRVGDREDALRGRLGVHAEPRGERSDRGPRRSAVEAHATLEEAVRVEAAEENLSARGAYELRAAEGGEAQATLFATGSEVSIAVASRDLLQADGVPTRVVSVPCWELFEAQDEAYRERVLPRAVTARVTVEAGIAQSWYKYVGDTGEIVSIERFGESADDKTLFREFGFTPEAVAAAAERAIDN